MPGKALSQPERDDSMRALSKHLKGLEKEGEGRARCPSFTAAGGLGWG